MDYALKFSGNKRVVLLADVFNLFNMQRTADYDNWSELSLGVVNPDFGKPIPQIVSRTAVSGSATDPLRRAVRVLRTRTGRDSFGGPARLSSSVFGLRCCESP